MGSLKGLKFRYAWFSRSESTFTYKMRSLLLILAFAVSTTIARTLPYVDQRDVTQDSTYGNIEVDNKDWQKPENPVDKIMKPTLIVDESISTSNEDRANLDKSFLIASNDGPNSEEAEVIRTPDGGLLTKYAAGTTVLTSPGGASVTTRPDGTRETRNASGGTETTYPDGTKVTTYAGGRRKTEHPDGTTENLYPSGGKDITYPNGRTDSTYPDGTMGNIDPDGTMELT